MQDVQFYAQYLANILLVCTALGLLLSVRNLRGRGWLIAFLVISLVTTTYYFAINSLMFNNTVSMERYRAIQDSWGRIIRIFDYASYALLIAFVLALKSREGLRTGVGKMLFSFRGRLNRLPYWIVALALLALDGLIFLVVADMAGKNRQNSQTIVISTVTGLLWFAVSLWISLAVQVKRWHDRDKSAWWVLIGFVPIVGGIWVLVENGFLRGTDGSNRYGPNPSRETSGQEWCRICAQAVSGGGLSMRVGDSLVHPVCDTCYSARGGSDLATAQSAGPSEVSQQESAG